MRRCLLAMSLAILVVLFPMRAYGAEPGVLDKIVELARSQQGVKYVWGGITPDWGFDCSGLVAWAYRQTGLPMLRTAYQQYLAAERIRAEEAQPGDLVFFGNTYDTWEPVTHVGIITGPGRMINATSRGGVREESLYTRYWYDRYVGTGRVSGVAE